LAARRSVAWTQEARRSLHEVLEFIALDAPERARRVAERVLRTARSLEMLPERGRVVPELVALLHGARDFERRRPDR
jgi:plasmid stabilization system protein ParE